MSSHYSPCQIINAFDGLILVIAPKNLQSSFSSCGIPGALDKEGMYV
jgi:hypothetical protein